MTLEAAALGQPILTNVDVKPASRTLLISILSRLEPSLLQVLDEATPDRRDVLGVLEAVGSELATYGFDDRYAPTTYGVLLEDLVDEVNRIGFS